MAERGRRQAANSQFWLEEVGLGLLLWQGDYEGVPNLWLRWCTRDGALIPTAREATLRAETEAAAEQERRPSRA